MHIYYHVLALFCLVWFSATTTHDSNGSLHAQIEQLKQIVSKQGHSIELLQNKVNKLTKKMDNCAEKHATAGDDSAHVESVAAELMKRQIMLTSAILQHENARVNASSAVNPAGVVYTRWGRKSCSSKSSLVYEGFAAGSWYNNGGGVDHQCLPLTPQYSRYNTDTYNSVIYGVEYQTHTDGDGPFPDSAHQQNVPCARCYAPRSAKMMIPGRISCPSRWTKEYSGYLMSNGDMLGYTPSTYICVDSYPEYIKGMSSNHDGALLYFVKTDCRGSGDTGHCPPYDEDKQLTCVVCTR